MYTIHYACILTSVHWLNAAISSLQSPCLINEALLFSVLVHTIRSRSSTDSTISLCVYSMLSTRAVLVYDWIVHAYNNAQASSYSKIFKGMITA
jgi:hypothetical protein